MRWNGFSVACVIYPLLSAGPQPCPPGMGGDQCLPCANGTWSAGGNSTIGRPQCQPCPVGSTNNKTGGTSLAECNGEGSAASHSCTHACCLHLARSRSQCASAEPHPHPPANTH